VTWLGHATVEIVTRSGARLLTDPVLRDRVAHLRRQVPTPKAPEHVDGVLLSHLHHDHFDKPSLRRVAGDQTTVVLPKDATPYLSGITFGTVDEVRAGDRVTIKGATVEAVPAWHDGRRRPGPGAPHHVTLGYVVDGVWFAGDTELNEGMSALHGDVDVALIPIWGWGSTLGPGHLDPRDAARATALVAPRIVIPIHWGTFLPYGVRRRDLLTMPPLEFSRYVAELAPATRVVKLSPGESVSL